MFLAHLLIGVDARMNGGFTASSSFYGAFWAYAAYLAFKTEVETLSKVLGWLIILNVCGFVYLAMLDSGGSPFSLTYFTKEDALVSVAITLAVKVGLWLYLLSEIIKIKDWVALMRIVWQMNPLKALTDNRLGRHLKPIVIARRATPIQAILRGDLRGRTKNLMPTHRVSCSIRRKQ